MRVALSSNHFPSQRKRAPQESVVVAWRVPTAHHRTTSFQARRFSVALALTGNVVPVIELLP